MRANIKLRTYLLIALITFISIRFTVCPAINMQELCGSLGMQVSVSDADEYMPLDYCFLSNLKLFEPEQLLLRIFSEKHTLAFLLVIFLLILRRRHFRLDFLARISKLLRYLNTCDTSSPFGGLSPPYSFALRSSL